MANAYRPVLYTLAAGVLLSIAAPAFACNSDGHRVHAREGQGNDRDCEKSTASQAQQSAPTQDVTILRMQDDAGYLRNAYVDGNGFILQVEDDK